ncbi:nucleotidyltransferase domain-containing protein [Alkalimonas amylolytica]|uniref:Uncharacterized nucleotidyltransferase n=1 Tax=Alkalimonas amylolytica TaxID=152573 RepID=A0A1H4CEG3_ALKAM|nr:nucleotidyltransferase family protein [Alkalimonas amylolytica]SEA58689.1 Uncharacterised nucleotidyltransferase [Alkalimonas amylolytica]
MQGASWLIALIKEPQLAATVPKQDWVLIIRLLRKQQLLARYSHLFRQAAVFDALPAYARHHLQNAEILARKQCNQVAFEASELVTLLAPLKVTPLFLKGAAYSLALGASIGQGRTYSDIDILVPKEAITSVEQRLALHGYFGEPMTPYDQHYYRQWTHEIPPVRHHSRGTIIDIHHNLVPPVSGRAPDISHFLTHLVTTEQGYQVLTLPAMTLHSIIHLLFNEEFKNGFRDLTDLHLLFLQFKQPAQWDALFELATATGFCTELFLACRYCRSILATAFPDDFYQRLERQHGVTKNQAILDFAFKRVLAPRHPVTDNWQDKLADTLCWLRGHWLKMPVSILLWHLIVKSSRGAMVAVLGKSYFEPERR